MSVEKFPLSSLGVLRRYLRDRGIPVSDATAVRHAAIERANQLVVSEAVTATDIAAGARILGGPLPAAADPDAVQDQCDRRFPNGDRCLNPAVTVNARGFHHCKACHRATPQPGKGGES